jgi:hypothetical protein
MKKHRELFRLTLGVPNANLGMLITDLLKTTQGNHMNNDDDYQHTKDLLKEIARLPIDLEELDRLDGEHCWPCHTPKSPHKFCSTNNFIVNDRQDLFEIFSKRHTFLDFDFGTTKKLTKLLESQSRISFLSKRVSIKTSFHGRCELDIASTNDFRARAGPLVTYADSSKKVRPSHTHHVVGISSLPIAGHPSTLSDS